MVSIYVFMVIAAVVCWILATFNAYNKYNLIAAGLALCGLAYIFSSILH